eukprot:1187304-Prorocentrum_minimum.AAC.4
MPTTPPACSRSVQSAPNMKLHRQRTPSTHPSSSGSGAANPSFTFTNVRVRLPVERPRIPKGGRQQGLGPFRGSIRWSRSHGGSIR